MWKVQMHSGSLQLICKAMLYDDRTYHAMVQRNKKIEKIKLFAYIYIIYNLSERQDQIGWNIFCTLGKIYNFAEIFENQCSTPNTLGKTMI